MILVLGSERLSLVEVEAFLRASESVAFRGKSRAEIYRWCEALLCYHEYGRLKRREKGLIRAYMERMSGLSRAQCTRLIAQYSKAGRIRVNRSKCHKFARRYTAADVAALARVDEAHHWLSGPATHPSGQGTPAGDPGHPGHPSARARGLRQERVSAAGDDLERPPVQPAQQPGVPQKGRSL